MTNKRTINFVALAISIVAWSWLYVFLHPRPPAIDRRAHEAAGTVLAGEAVKRLDPSARLILIARDPQNFLVPASEAQVNGFRRALKKAGKAVTITHGFKVDPLRVVAVPPGDFYEVLRTARDSDVIVSLLGPPILSGEQLAKLGGKRPHVLAACLGGIPGEDELKKVFEQKLLSAAVISRGDAPARSSGGDMPSVFAQMFRLVTASDLPEMRRTAARE